MLDAGNWKLDGLCEMIETIKVISIQSPNAAYTCREIAGYIGDQLGTPTEFVEDISWQEREQWLDAGRAQVGWICGLPYVWKADREPPPIELVAAPVMRHPRYGGRPVYYSDVIVHRDNPYRDFADLRGASWAYNEPHSQSGCNITRYHLAQLGESKGYFGRVIEAESHPALGSLHEGAAGAAGGHPPRVLGNARDRRGARDPGAGADREDGAGRRSGLRPHP
jgi:ABC-type phosphate/phosphonate transport system substrate-binding protein